MSSVSRRIQVRRDTAENWTSINPILADGEIGYETTGFKRMKVGDGRTRWAVLAYFNVGPTGKLGPTGPIGLPGEASNTGATGPTGVPGLSSGVTFQLNYTSAGPIAYSTAVTTLAGSSQGLANDPGTAARFYNPSATAVDSSGIVYVADTENNCIRRITSAGLVTTFAGDGTPGAKDGSGSNAQFNSPSAIVITSAGILYVSDAGNHRIRKITSTGIVSTFAGSTSGFQDGIGTNAQFDSPQGIVVDSLGNVFVADANNHRIRIITSAGQVSTFAGQATSGITNDSGASARFNTPTGLAIDSSGNLYVADKNNHRIRKVTPQASVSTLAGSTAGFTDNTGTAAQFSSPVGIAVDSTGTLYVADTGNHRIRTVSSSGVVTTFVGLSSSGNANGTPSQAQFSSPYSITVGTTGVFYVADYGNHRIRKIVVTASDPNEYGFTPFTGTLMTPLNSLPTSSSYIVVPERKTDTHVATFTIPISGMPSTTSIVGQWVLGLNASVALSSSPGSFYFEALDGTSSIVVGTSNRVTQTTSGVILATMTVPARTYATNLTLKLFVTTRDLSPMTIRFNGSTLSYLNTTIINVGPTGATGPHLFTIFNKLNHRVITSITDKSDELFANSNLTFNGSNLNVVNTVTTSNFRGQGTVSTPPYAFTGDVTSGMFLPTESNLAFTTAGVERMRITTGNVGIATPTPGFTLDVSGTANVSGNLSVGTISTSGGGFSVPGNLTGGIIRSSSNGTAAAPAYTFSNDLTTGTFLPSVSNLALTTAGVERVRVLPNGNVGIGTTAPGFTLDVTGTANVSGNLSVGSITTAGGGFSVPGNLTGGIIRSSSNGTAALPAYTFSNDLTTGAFLPAVSNLALTTAGVERVRILPSGNVGIGTTTPGFTLDVTGTANISGNLSVGSITTAGGGFSVPGNLTGAIIRSSSNGTPSQPVYTFTSDLSSGLFIPFTGGLGYATAGRERMTITSSGRVGIGNSDPENTLDVTGTTRITSTLSAGATTVTSLAAGSGSITTTGNVSAGSATVTGTLTAGTTTVSSLGAGSGAITTSGNLTGGTTTVTSLAAGSGAITTTGNLSAGSTTVTSLAAGSGAITTTGNLSAGNASITGVVSSGNGTAGAPSHTFINSTNTGMFSPGSGSVAFSIGGSERMRIAGNGSIGIGRTDPTNALDVTGTVRFSSTLSAGATTVTSLDAGSGAISTTGTLTGGTTTITGTLSAGATTVTGLGAGSGNITTTGNLVSGSGNAGAPTHTFSGNTTVGMFSPAANSVAWTTASTERMRILANGNVGVGTQAPTVLFDVNGAMKTTTLTATSASITDVTLTNINGSKYSAGGGGTQLILSLQGNGTASITVFSSFLGFYALSLAIDGDNNLYSTHSENVYATLSTGGAPELLAGSGTRASTDGTYTGASFNQPAGIVFYGGSLYVIEYGTSRIRKVTLSRVVTTFLSTGITTATRIAVDSAGNLYVPDTGSRTIKKVTPSAVVSTLAGSGTSGTADGTGTNATFTASLGAITVDWNGNVLVKDGTDGRIRRITPAGVVTTLNTSFVFETNPASPFLGVNGAILADNVNQVYYFGKDGIVKVVGGVALTFTGTLPNNGLVISTNGELYGTSSAIIKYSFALTSSYGGTPNTTANLEKSYNPLSSLMTYTVNQAITNTHAFTFTMNNSQNAMNIAGEWTLQLFGRVLNTALPASFYFEVLDGTNTVATGSPTSVNISTNSFFAATATVPGRTFTTNVNIKIYITCQAGSTLTILFNTQPSLSFLNTTLFSTGEIRDFYTSGLERMRITAGGFVGIGTTNPQQLLDVNGNVRAVAFPTASDRRLKTDIVTISDAVNLVKRLRGVYYTNIADRQRAMGLIAQETEGVIPEVVYTSGDDLKSISYGNIVGVLVEAVKTLSERLETLEKKG